MLSISLASLPLLLAAVVHAAIWPSTRSGCSLSQARLTLPSNQKSLTSPTGAPSFIALGVGVQNYTCNDTSLTYTSVGALAEVFDISCIVGSSLFNSIQIDVFDIWVNMSASETTQDLIKMLGNDPLVLGQHYFVGNGTNPATGGQAISPVWDFRSNGEKGNPEAMIVASRVGDIPAPTGPQDIDWLQLKKVSGGLADQVFRVDTKSGQPPKSCKDRAPMLSVKYTTKYWLFGGSVER